MRSQTRPQTTGTTHGYEQSIDTSASGSEFEHCPNGRIQQSSSVWYRPSSQGVVRVSGRPRPVVRHSRIRCAANLRSNVIV